MPETRRNPFRVENSRHQEKRRSEFLQRSKQARADAIQQARSLATQSDADTDVDTDIDFEVRMPLHPALMEQVLGIIRGTRGSLFLSLPTTLPPASMSLWPYTMVVVVYNPSQRSAGARQTVVLSISQS
jgi:hypothetical protein